MRRSLPAFAALLLAFLLPAAAFAVSHKPYHPKPNKVKRHKAHKH